MKARSTALLAGGAIFILLFVSINRRPATPYDLAPELRPLLETATRTTKGYDTHQSVGFGSSAPERSYPHLSYDVPQRIAPVAAWARENLKAEDGWAVNPDQHDLKWDDDFSAVKRDQNGFTLVDMTFSSTLGATEIEVELPNSPASSFRAWDWRSFKW